jgi:tRNA-dihydrouridine synthase
MKVKVALAPMAGITDSAFRLINKFGGADLVYSEMAHANAISFNSQKTLSILRASLFEFPYVVQLFGNDPKYFAKAAKIISERGVPAMRYKPFSSKRIRFINKLVSSTKFPVLSNCYFLRRFTDFQNKLKTRNWELPAHPVGGGTKYCIPSGLDINLGCPAKKVFGHGSGAALWKDLPKVRKILEAVLGNTKLPVSIKTRTAVGKISIFDLLDYIKDLPLKRIMIHGRSYQQGFSGPIDAKVIKEAIKKYPQFEFWVNGGIVDRESAQKVIKETDCPNLGIARGACGNPLLAEEIRATSPSPLPASPAGGLRKEGKSCPYKGKVVVARRPGGFDAATKCLLAYIHSILNFQSKGPRGILEMRKHLCWYFKDFPGAKVWRRKLVAVENIEDIENILEKIARQKQF